LDLDPVQILTWFIQRWQLETTFEEARAHLGLDTPRGGNEQSVSCMTPALFGLYSIVTLMATPLISNQEAPVQIATWNQKQQATFSDTIDLVRRYLWGIDLFPMLQAPTNMVKIPRALLKRFTDARCYPV
jgi:hypothetical protein